MASAESTDGFSGSEVLSGFFPMIIGVMGPTPDSDPDRIVLVNPVTQGMIVLRGDAAAISEILLGGGATDGGAPPASKSAIDSMKSVDAAVVEDDEECSICLDELRKEGGNEGEAVMVEVKEMPCRHRFHGVCIGKWLKMHGSCPVCRFLMPVEEGEAGKKEGGGGGGGGDEGGRLRRTEREVWVTIALSRRERREDQDQDQQNHQQEDEHQQREDS